VQQRRLGDPTVGAIGLGDMPLSIEGGPDEAQAVRTVQAALGAGVTLVDTADAYCLGADDVGHNERLLARAPATWSGDRDGRQPPTTPLEPFAQRAGTNGSSGVVGRLASCRRSP
jgi:diketogulonate reductase-like aldo/keto reductase